MLRIQLAKNRQWIAAKKKMELNQTHTSNDNNGKQALQWTQQENGQLKKN